MDILTAPIYFRSVLEIFYGSIKHLVLKVFVGYCSNIYQLLILLSLGRKTEEFGMIMTLKTLFCHNRTAPKNDLLVILSIREH